MKEIVQASVDVVIALGAKEFLGKILGPPAEDVGLLLRDQVHNFRFKNQVKILTKARAFLDEQGIQPQKVPLKTLAPILEFGSLEEDESMIEKWAALLASAADPASTSKVQPSFPEILKQLSAREAVILDTIFAMVIKEQIPRAEWSNRGARREPVKQIARLEDEEYEISIDNLYRLRLCAPPAIQLAFLDNKDARFQLRDKSVVCLTEFGFAFATSCQPPSFKKDAAPPRNKTAATLNDLIKAGVSK